MALSLSSRSRVSRSFAFASLGSYGRRNFAAGQILALKLMSEMKSSKMASAKIVTALLGVVFNICGATVAGLPGVVAALLAFSAVYLVWMILLARATPHLGDARVLMARERAPRD